ncbi:hypothetical protein NDU88_000045 [Pleurodeles waltl]|uniref:BZIP domain-containing protein n=1 Tax=Pleurodeles waltl TaxID=8319 RepID=A0AAV7VX03_PLEWA|nr:hypothetical protein NDU88_000045 [Pleurodeles waltl]
MDYHIFEQQGGGSDDKTNRSRVKEEKRTPQLHRKEARRRRLEKERIKEARHKLEGTCLKLTYRLDREPDASSEERYTTTENTVEPPQLRRVAA